MALTAHSTIGDWINDPTGGPLIRALFEQTGADPELLTPKSCQENCRDKSRQSPTVKN